MHIHISKKMLKETKFKVEKLGDTLNIKGYDMKSITEDSCENCQMSTFQNNYTINIDELEFVKRCTCNKEIPPMVSFKVDTSKTKTITIV